MRTLPVAQRAQLDLWVEGAGRTADRLAAMRALTRCDGSEHTFRRIANVLTQREPLSLRIEAAGLLATGWGNRATSVLDETLSLPLPTDLSIAIAGALGNIASGDSVSALRRHQTLSDDRTVQDAIRIALRKASKDQPHNQ